MLSSSNDHLLAIWAKSYLVKSKTFWPCLLSIWTSGAATILRLWICPNWDILVCNVNPPKPGPQCSALYRVCTVSVLHTNTLLANWSIVGLLILFYLVLKCVFCILLDDYNYNFSGSPCYNVNYCNYNYVLPYYIVIQMQQSQMISFIT